VAQLPKFATTNFKDLHEVDAWLKVPAWKPSMGEYGLPMNSSDVLKCVGKIYDALIDLGTVWDQASNPNVFDKFKPGGEWSNPKDLEASAFAILHSLVSLHKHGLTGLASRRLGTQPPNSFDRDFTFHQRLYWTALLVRHYKEYADKFMLQIMSDAVVGSIWMVLTRDAVFNNLWANQSNHAKGMLMYQLPYEGMTVNGLPVAHPSPEEAQRLAAEVAAQEHAASLQQTQAEPSSTAPAHLASRSAGKRAAAEDFEVEAGPSSRRRTDAPIPEDAAQYVDLPSIPFAPFDGTTDTRPSSDLGSGQAETALGEGTKSTSREPLEELLDMGDGQLFHDFGPKGSRCSR
jgi:hypothetical protein